MKSNENCRLELVSAQRIKRMPGMQIGAAKNHVGKAKAFAQKRGYCNPVVLSDDGGFMTLLSGGAAYEACIESKGGKLPAVIVQTEGEADALMFTLQSAELSEPLSAISTGASIVRLIDQHSVPRKHIIETLGKSSTWLNRMETLSRKLNAGVQRLVAEGHVPSRSAQEIARLPGDVQMAFSISAANDFLSKEDIAHLVNRYLNRDTGQEERGRIISAPKSALPEKIGKRHAMGADNSPGARLSRAIARCMDGNTYLSNILRSMDIDRAAVRAVDVCALSDSLMDLLTQIHSVFPPGGSEGGGAHD